MKKLFALLIVFLMAPIATAPMVSADDAKSLHDFTITSIDMEDMDLSQFKGKAVLLVNTASECGFTPQYEGLQELWTEYKDRGLVVLGMPANNFGDQEPGSAADIKKFCEMNFQVSFPMGDKIDVVGPNRHALYDFMSASLGKKSEPKWNFHKYLIDTDGKPVAYFSSRTRPMSTELKKAIKAQLPGA